MPDFQPHSLDLAICRTEVMKLKDLLDHNTTLSEKVIRDQLYTQTHICGP